MLTRHRCAVGAAFETRFHPAFLTFPKSLVDYFVDRARESLEEELNFPSVATVQAMMVMSCHEVGNGNRTRAWLYSGNGSISCYGIAVAKYLPGMSVRLAFDLALHLDMSTNVLLRQVTASEADMRRRLFWSVCNADQ